MFGPKLNTVFASRWRAVWFSASVLLFAWMMVPAEESAENADEAIADVRSAADQAGLSDEGRAQVEATLKNLEKVSGKK